MINPLPAEVHRVCPPGRGIRPANGPRCLSGPLRITGKFLLSTRIIEGFKKLPFGYCQRRQNHIERKLGFQRVAQYCRHTPDSRLNTMSDSPFKKSCSSLSCGCTPQQPDKTGSGPSGSDRELFPTSVPQLCAPHPVACCSDRKPPC